MSNSVLHVMRNHQCSKVIAVDNPVCDIQHLGSCFWVKGCGMLIKKEKLWLLKGCHEKRKCLSLTSGKKTYLRGKTILKTKIQNLQKLFVLFTFGF